MKTLTVVLTLIAVLLAGAFSSPTGHAMPMSDAVNVVAAHDCCDQQQAQQKTAECQHQGSFCQHCEQHCAGQIGLVSIFLPLTPYLSDKRFAPPLLSIVQRSERLIRPPKLIAA